MIDDLVQLGKLVSLGLALMLPLANPLTSMTMLLSLGQHIPYKERDRQIQQAACYVVGIMLVTYYAGAWIMATFGISIPGLRIAGGMIVVSIGFSMLFPAAANAASDEREADVAADVALHRQVPNIAFVPLALPGTAGPGTIAMIISAASTAGGETASHYPAWTIAVAPLIVFVLLGCCSGFACARPAASSPSSATAGSRPFRASWAFCWSAWACSSSSTACWKS